MISAAVEAKLRAYAQELCELGLDRVDLDLFEMEVEEEWKERANAIWEYFGASPDQLEQWVLSELSEIEWLEEFFLEREEYEKCAVLLRLQDSWKEEFAEVFAPVKKKKPRPRS